MKDKRPALGRGLSALLPVASGAASGGPTVLECPVSRIDASPGQPRRHFDDAALADLSASIQASGILQPIVVSREGDRFRVIAGERRLRAAIRAGLQSVPVVVRQATPEDAFVLALVENLQREDLNPVEQAHAFRRLVEEFGMTQDEVARRVGKQRSTVANALRLLRLAPPVLEALADGRVAEGTARALLALPEARQPEALDRVLSGDLNTRAVEALVRQWKDEEEPAPAAPEPAMADYFESVRAALEAATGLAVKLSFRGNRGKVTFPFSSLAGLRRIADRLGGGGQG